MILQLKLYLRGPEDQVSGQAGHKGGETKQLVGHVWGELSILDVGLAVENPTGQAVVYFGSSRRWVWYTG